MLEKLLSSYVAWSRTKGQCHEIFSKICGDIRSSRCTTGVTWQQWRICRRWRWHRRQIYDTSGKFAADVVDTGGNVDTAAPWIFVKFRNDPNFSGLGKMIHEKNLKQKSRGTVLLILHTEYGHSSRDMQSLGLEHPVEFLSPGYLQLPSIKGLYIYISTFCTCTNGFKMMNLLCSREKHISSSCDLLGKHIS